MDMVKVFDALASKAEQAIPTNANDYERDGILYCGNCDTPKQSVLDIPLVGVRKVKCMCRCENERYVKEIAEQEEQQRMIRVRNMRSAGMHDKSLERMNFASDNGQCPQMYIAEKYVARWDDMRKENISLLLYGGIGSGKTFAAACIANALIDRGVPVLMTTSARIIDKALSFDAGYDFLKEMNEYSLIVIDDFGAERGTEYATQKLFDLIDARVKQGKPMILTSNVSLEEMENPKDLSYARIFSRVTGACIPIRFTGADMRKKQGEEKRTAFVKYFKG